MPKIIHAADIHLDAPFSLFDVQKAQVRKNELRGTFTSLMLYAKTEQADLMLLPGDLFDSGFVTKETMALITSQFAALPSCRFVIAPGNHDPFTARSPYTKEAFPPNVFIFDKETLSCFSFDDIGVNVYGFAYLSETHQQNPLVGMPPLDRSKINLLAAHCDLGGRSDCCPITVQDLERTGFDYAALGHIHKGGEVARAGSTFYAYSGCLEGRSFDECGIKGVIVCDLQKQNGRLVAEFTSRRICRRRYERMTLDITGLTSDTELAERVRTALAAAGYGTDTLLRLRLTGRVSPEHAPKSKTLDAQSLGLFYLETENDTMPTLGDEALKNDLSIRGAFYRELLPKLTSEDEAERRTAAEALRYGLAALDGGDVIDF